MLTVLSNIICADNTAEKIKEDEIRDLLKQNYNIYRLGSLSYNLLYFYDAFSKTENTWVRNCAKSIEDYGVKYFDLAKKYISKANKSDIPALNAYVLGSAVHFILKYRTNPYVSYITKGINERTLLNEKAVKTDCALLNYFNKEMSDIRDITDISENDIKVIEGLYRYLISEIKKEIIPDGLIADCINKLNKAITQKKSILPHPGKEFVYKAAADTENILNENHLTWSDPANDCEKSNFSYPQLISYAQKDCNKALPKLYTALFTSASQSCEFVFRNYK